MTSDATTEQPTVTSETSSSGVLVVTIANPGRGNALTPDMSSALISIWKRVDADDSVRAIVITAVGERAFSAGNDLTGTPPDDDPEWNFAGLDQLAGVRKPVICAMNGYAVGGGLEIALASDIRLASTTATFSLPEPRLGIIASMGGTQRLPRVIGLGRAMHMLLTAAPIDAATALDWGLVTQVSEPDELLASAVAIAELIVALGPRAVRATKAAANASFDVSLAEGRDIERGFSHVLRYTDETQEGRAAFREKRAPSFPPATLTDAELDNPAFGPKAVQS